MWKQFNIYTLVGVNKPQTGVLPVNVTFALGWAHLPVRTLQLRDCSDGFGAKWRNMNCKKLWVKLFIRIMTATGPCQPQRGFVIPDVTQAFMDKHVATIMKERITIWKWQCYKCMKRVRYSPIRTGWIVLTSQALSGQQNITCQNMLAELSPLLPSHT